MWLDNLYFVGISVLFSGGSTSTSVTNADWKTVIDSVIGQYSVANIVQVLVSIVTAGIGFVFLWWGVRKAYRAIMSAVRKGRMGV